MEVSQAVRQIQDQFSGALSVVVGSSDTPLNELLNSIDDVNCTAEQFRAEAFEVYVGGARTLLISTLRRSMAYSSVEYMALEQARTLANALISSLGHDARFYSTCDIPMDEEQSVGSWRLLVTSHTFESVLYCIGKDSSVLFVVTDED